MLSGFWTTNSSAKSSSRRSRPMGSDNEKTYEVGYGKPPVATRFQKGKSGNTSGQPKKVPQPLDPGIILESIDNEEIVVIDNGKRKRMTKSAIQLQQLFTKPI